MIEIDLLPEELRKKKSFHIPRVSLKFMPLLIGIIALLALGQGLIVLVIGINKGAYERMTKEWDECAPKKKAAELIRKENADIKKKLYAIESLVSRKMLWSKKLNQLSDLVVPGMWFTEISTKKKVFVTTPKKTKGKRAKKSFGIKRLVTERVEAPYLSIAGEVSSVYGEGLVIVGRFIDRLKSSPGFIRDFTGLELNSTELHSIEGTEATRFGINGYLKEARGDVVSD